MRHTEKDATHGERCDTRRRCNTRRARSRDRAGSTEIDELADGLTGGANLCLRQDVLEIQGN